MTFKLPPILTFLAIPNPPFDTTEPVVVEVESVWSLSLTIFDEINWPLIFVWSLLTIIFWLKVTGPSNWDRICFDLPPSTRILSLTTTSSNATLNLEGFCPVIVGIGIAKVVWVPLLAEYLVFPMKKSPLLFIPVYNTDPPDFCWDCTRKSSLSVRVLTWICGNAVE